MNEEYPLATFALFTYNQEAYVRQAIKGAIAQDYPNLEIIISDDCSSDRTYEIIESMLTPHDGRVLIRQNEKNMGVAAHINEVMRIAKGEIIVVAAGDDISARNRCSAIVEAWVAAEKKPDSICSTVRLIDQKGALLGTVSCDESAVLDGDFFTGRRWILGCSHAWTRRGFDVFGELPEYLQAEDKAIGFRSALLGGLLYINQALVDYRVHVDSITSSNSSLKKAFQSAMNLKCHSQDIQALVNVLTVDRVSGIRNSLELQIKQADARIEVYSATSILSRILSVFRNWNHLSTKEIIRVLKRL